MFQILAPTLAIVKSVYLSTDTALCIDGFDDAWTMDDATADELAAEAEAYAMYEAGLSTW